MTSKNSHQILLTGSSGFIGRNLKANLLAEGYEIFEINRKNGFDLSNRNWTKSIPNKSFDYIIHLAQSNQYRDFPDGAVDMVQINIEATFEFLEWSRNNGIKCFFYASTGNVYEQKPSPLTENDRTLPNSFYGTTKLCAENLIIQYQKYFNTKIMRLFGVYGPGQKSMIIINLIEKILKNKEILLAKGIGLKFNPLFVEDCSRIICYLIKRESSSSTILNVAGREIVELREVVEKLGKLLDVTPRVTTTDDLETNLVANINALKNLFPTFGTTSLSTGLEKTSKWVQEQNLFR